MVWVLRCFVYVVWCCADLCLLLECYNSVVYRLYWLSFMWVVSYLFYCAFGFSYSVVCLSFVGWLVCSVLLFGLFILVVACLVGVIWLLAIWVLRIIWLFLYWLFSCLFCRRLYCLFVCFLSLLVVYLIWLCCLVMLLLLGVGLMVGLFTNSVALIFWILCWCCIRVCLDCLIILLVC